MHKYVIKRLLMMIPVLLCVAFVIYAIMNVAEGDPVYSVVSADATEAQIEAAREELGLNGTLLERYFRYVKGMLTGDLGTSYVSTVFPLSHKSSVTSPPSLNTGKFRPIRFSGYSDSSFL